MDTWVLLMLLAGVFLGLALRSGKPSAVTPKAGPSAASPQHENLKADINTTKAKVEVVPAEPPPPTTVPDIFHEDSVRQELARFASTPSVLQKYVDRAKSRFTKTGERALIAQWIGLYEAGQRLIAAKTEMERRTAEYCRLANEHELKAKEKEAAIAKYDADVAEQLLRRDTADNARHRIKALDPVSLEKEGVAIELETATLQRKIQEQRQPPPPPRSKEEEEIARIVSAIDSIEGLKRAWTAKKQNSPEEQHVLIDRLFRKAIDARLEKL